jgi:hypothetical protein
MPYHPAGSRLGVPRFRRIGLPTEEWDNVSFLQWLLASLEGYIRRFDFALQLLEQEGALLNDTFNALFDSYAQLGHDTESVRAWMRAEQARQWAHIAARDAAISVFHIHHVLEALKVHAPKIGATLRSDVDTDAIKKARALFKQNFPSAEMLRHGVTHSAQNAKDPSKAEFNAIKLADGNRMEDYEGSLVGDFFALTVGGKLESMRLNSVSLAQLREVQALAYDAFKAAAEKAELLAKQAEDARPTEGIPLHQSGPPHGGGTDE